MAQHLAILTMLTISIGFAATANAAGEQVYDVYWWDYTNPNFGPDLWTSLMASSGLAAGIVGTRLLADYNADGVVNTADQVAWRKAYGKTNFPYAEGNRYGKVDAADYAFWRKLAGPAAAVPKR